jgi:hypothetical protein
MMNFQGEREDRDRQDGIAIEPETILPAQFGGGAFKADLQPEKRLMLAVLEDAVATFQKYALSTAPRASADFNEVQQWFAADDQLWPFSFVNICSVLGLDAGRMRRGLAEWRELRRAGLVTAVTSSPFRRVGGTRHKATGRAPGMRHLQSVA